MLTAIGGLVRSCHRPSTRHQPQVENLQEGIATFYDESSGLWEEMWGEHMHHGGCGAGTVGGASGCVVPSRVRACKMRGNGWLSGCWTTWFLGRSLGLYARRGGKLVCGTAGDHSVMRVVASAHDVCVIVRAFVCAYISCRRVYAACALVDVEGGKSTASATACQTNRSAACTSPYTNIRYSRPAPLRAGYYPGGELGSKSNQEAQIDMIEETLKFAGVTAATKVGWAAGVGVGVGRAWPGRLGGWAVVGIFRRACMVSGSAWFRGRTSRLGRAGTGCAELGSGWVVVGTAGSMPQPPCQHSVALPA